MPAAVRAFRPLWWTRLLRHAWRLLALGTAVLVCCTRIHPVSPAGAAILFPLVAFGCTCLLAGSVSSATCMGRHRLSGTGWLATLAFSLYLTHRQACAWLDVWLPQAGLPPVPAFAIYLAASLAPAWLLYLAVERPGLRLRERYLANRQPGGARALAAQAEI